jgi:hypothetical protein
MIELSDVLRELRSELDRARNAAADEELGFELGPIELEVTVGVEQTGGVGGKVRFWVLELGGDGRASRNSTQRIKLTLQPTLASQGATSVRVSGEEAARER